MSAIDRTVIAATARLPCNWFGLRLAIGLRRIVTMRLARGSGVDVERWGLRMRLHPLDNGCEKGLLFTPQMYETRERAELAAEIDRTAGRPFVFIDIGANVGLFSLFVASRAGFGARIVAVEPEPENLRRLRFNVAANPGIPIRVLPIALGEVAGEVAIEANYHDRGGARTRPGSGIHCLPLLNVLNREGVSAVDALKIDVEGSEGDILLPFFRDADTALWPRLLIIEGDDLLLALTRYGYQLAGRTRLNVILKLNAKA